MRVLINAVAARAGGGQRQLAPFVIALADRRPDATYDVVVTEDFQDRLPHRCVRWLEVDVPQGINLRRLWWDNVRTSRFARDYDVLVSPLNFGPIAVRVPHVLFQRNPIYFDRDHYRTLGRAARVVFAGYRWLATLGMNAADAVVVPSHAMAELVRPYVRDRRKLRVIHHGFDADQSRQLAIRAIPSAAAEWLQLDVRLLHVGHPSQHKNYPVLLRTLERVAAARPSDSVGLAVTVAASDGSAEVRRLLVDARKLGLSERVHLVGSVPIDDVHTLYRAAHVVLFPSLAESFGFPILEAFAQGTPVVASRLPALVEIGGDLACYHDRLDDQHAAELVLAALDGQSPELAAELRRYAERFSWDKQARAVLDVMSSVLLRSRRRHKAPSA